MFDSKLAAFVLASFLIVAVPGPGQALVLARSLASGPGAGVRATLGLNLATMVHAIGAGLGTAALFTRFPTLFTAVQIAGAAYLLFLGVAMWRARTVATEAPRPLGGRVVAHAFATGLTNPKMALFVASFLPQFVDPRGAIPLEYARLGATLAAISVAWDSALAFAASSLAARVGASPRAATGTRRALAALFVLIAVACVALPHGATR